MPKRSPRTEKAQKKTQQHAYSLRPRKIGLSYDENPHRKTRVRTVGLRHRFDVSQSVEILRIQAESVAIPFFSPSRAVELAGLHSYTTGSKDLMDYRAAPPKTPIPFAGFSFKTAGEYKAVAEETYVVTKENLESSRGPRRPTNQVLFKQENADGYALRKGVLVEGERRYEYCHHLAHRFLGNHAQTRDNLFVQTADFNTQQLVVENIITRLALLLGEVEVHQKLERFMGSNLGRKVSYEIRLPGIEPYCIEVLADNAHIKPHIDWEEAHLKMIAQQLQDSKSPEIQKLGENLEQELDLAHVKRRRKEMSGPGA